MFRRELVEEVPLLEFCFIALVVNLSFNTFLKVSSLELKKKNNETFENVCFLDTIKTRKEHNAWKEWRALELERDIEFCHPRWPQEAMYVKSETKAVRNLSLMSSSDYWIYFDWVALVFILATITSHVVFFHYSTDLSKEIHHYITMPLLLILWLRISKYARPFESAGPFIVIFSNVIGDIAKWAFLNLVIIIPFTCAFWITFGANSLNPVDGYNNIGPLLFNMFSMMVVDNHGFKDLEIANPFMARLLCGSFIAIAAIVALNLLIALLTNTFERLYENAVANAVMQRAQTILLLQKSLRKKQKSAYYNFIKDKGSPEVISRNLGRLMMKENDETTIERVHDDIQEIIDILEGQFGKKFQKSKKSALDFVRKDVSDVQKFQKEIVDEMKNMKLLLDKMRIQLDKDSSIVNMSLSILSTNDDTNENNLNSNVDNNSDDDGNTSVDGIETIDNELKNNSECETDYGKEIERKVNKKGNKNGSSKSILHKRSRKDDSKSQQKSNIKNSKTKFHEIDSNNSLGTHSDSTGSGEDEDNTNIKCRKNRKKHKKGRKRGEKTNLGLTNNLQNKLPEKYNGKTKKRMANVQAPLNDAPWYNSDSAIATQLPRHVTTSLYDVNNPDDANLERSIYTIKQSEIPLPGTWNHQNIPYNLAETYIEVINVV